MPKKMRCRQKREEGQTKCRHNRQIVDASGAGQLMNARRKVGKLNEKNTAGPF